MRGPPERLQDQRSRGREAARGVTTTGQAGKPERRTSHNPGRMCEVGRVVRPLEGVAHDQRGTGEFGQRSEQGHTIFARATAVF
jgi:hypothetical protein